jgi:hypothetical protein
MKYLMIAIAFVGTTASISALAQSNAQATQQPALATQVAANTTTDAAPAGQWVAPYGPATPGKTRAQVYQELVHAQQDGQLDHLNSTVFAH